MKVDVKQIALQKISIRVVGTEAKIRIVKPLVRLADLSAERQEDIFILSERDEFDRLPKIVAFGGIGQKTPILLVARKWIQGSRERSRFFLSHHASCFHDDQKKYEYMLNPEQWVHSAFTCCPELETSYVAAKHPRLQLPVERRLRQSIAVDR